MQHGDMLIAPISSSMMAFVITTRSMYQSHLIVGADGGCKPGWRKRFFVLKVRFSLHLECIAPRCL
jgi:hypothetical protein